MLILCLSAGAVIVIAGVVAYQAVLKPRRRKALERQHARNKVSRTRMEA